LTDTATTQQRQRRDLLAYAIFDPDTDIEPAREQWQAHNSPQLADLLDDDGDWVFDPSDQTYTRGVARLKQDDLKRLSLALALAVELDLEHLGQQYANGDCSADELTETVAGQIKALAVNQAALAVGGYDAIEAQDAETMIQIPRDDLVSTSFPGFGAEGPRGLGDDLERLEGFGEQLRAATVASGEISGPQAANRAGQYAQTSNAIYEAVRRNSWKRALKSQQDEAAGAADTESPPTVGLALMERNLLDPMCDDHCSECPELTEAGWVPIDTLPPPGCRECWGNCRCAMDYAIVAVDPEGNYVDPDQID